MLPSESSVLESQPSKPAPPPSQPLVDWQQYYIFRELPLHSPVAAILSYPMTLYYIITTHLRKDGGCLLSSSVEFFYVYMIILILISIFMSCARFVWRTVESVVYSLFSRRLPLSQRLWLANYLFHYLKIILLVAFLCNSSCGLCTRFPETSEHHHLHFQQQQQQLGVFVCFCQANVISIFTL